MDPFTGSLIAAAIKAIFDIGSVGAANQFNSPRAMRNRLKKAGLPLAYMYQGKVMGQSEVPKLSIDPTLAIAQTRKLEQDQPKIDAEVKRIEADTAGQTIDNEVNAGIRDFLLMQGESGGRFQGTNQQINLKIEQEQKKVALFISEHEERIKQINRLVENFLFADGVQVDLKKQGLQKIKQQIINLGKQAGLLDQLENIRDFEEWLNQQITINIHSLPQWARALTATLLKLNHYK